MTRHDFICQRQTLNGPPTMQMYAGYEIFWGWHPVDDLPRLPLAERYQSFCERLNKAVNR